MERDGDRAGWVTRMRHDMMASGDALDDKADALQCPDHLPGIDGRQSRTHAATVIFRIVGVESSGIGSP